jgi:hypothetical protein
MTSMIAIVGEGARPTTEDDTQWEEALLADADRRAVGTSSREVDRVISMLADIVMRTQHLPTADQRRIRDLVANCHSTLSATTVLPREDQQAYEKALRAKVRK